MRIFPSWGRPEPAPKPEPVPYVACDECGVLVMRESAQTVEMGGHWTTRPARYCAIHRKAYTRMHDLFGMSFYYREMQVDEHGVPVGYEPIKAKAGKK